MSNICMAQRAFSKEVTRVIVIDVVSSAGINSKSSKYLINPAPVKPDFADFADLADFAYSADFADFAQQFLNKYLFNEPRVSTA